MDFSYRVVPSEGEPSQDGKKGWDEFFFSGHINEDAELILPQVVSEVRKHTIFDLKDISSINSCGIRAWVHFIRDVEKNRHNLIFRHCTPEVVSQMNMIPNFKGKAQIHSVYAAYLCPSCQHEILHLFEKDRNLPRSPSDELEGVPCPECKTIMEMEELEEEFFSWLEGMKT